MWGTGNNEYGLVGGSTAKGACSMDGSGYWVVGDPQRTLYVANGATTGTIVNNNADPNGNLQLQGCTAYVANGLLPRVVYFGRTTGWYIYMDQTTVPTENWATTMTVPRNPQYTVNAPYSGGQARFPLRARARARRQGSLRRIRPARTHRLADAALTSRLFSPFRFPFRALHHADRRQQAAHLLLPDGAGWLWQRLPGHLPRHLLPDCRPRRLAPRRPVGCRRRQGERHRALAGRLHPVLLHEHRHLPGQRHRRSRHGWHADRPHGVGQHGLPRRHAGARDAVLRPWRAGLVLHAGHAWL